MKHCRNTEKPEIKRYHIRAARIFLLTANADSNAQNKTVTVKSTHKTAQVAWEEKNSPVKIWK